MKIRPISKLVDELYDLYREQGCREVTPEDDLKRLIREKLLLNYPQQNAPELVGSSILMGDMRGFTRYSETFSPVKVIALLNRYFSLIVPLVDKYGGFIDKFMGDAVMGVFAANSSDDVLHTLRCAIEIQMSIASLNDQIAIEGGDSMHMGIGIDTGDVVAGLLGTYKHQEYTFIGNHVNLAARVESYSMRGQILISENTYALCHKDVAIGSVYDVQPKGKKHNLQIFELTGIAGDDQLHVPRVTRRKYVRVSVNLDFKFNIVEGKDLSTEIHSGHAVDISYTGIGILTRTALPTLTEIRIMLSLSFLGPDFSDIYAKVVRCVEKEGQYLIGLEFTSISDSALAGIKTFIDSSIFQS